MLGFYSERSERRNVDEIADFTLCSCIAGSCVDCSYVHYNGGQRQVLQVVRIDHPLKLKSEVKSTGDDNHTEEMHEQEGLMDGEDQTILLHNMKKHPEKIEIYRAVQEESSKDETHNLKCGEQKKTSGCRPMIHKLLEMPVIIFNIPENPCIGSMVCGKESNEIRYRKNYF